MHADIPKDFKKIMGNIHGYNVSDQYIAQEEREVRKWAECLIYGGITCHIWVHRIGSTVVQIIPKKHGPVASKHSNRRSLQYACSMAYLGSTTGRHQHGVGGIGWRT